MHVSAFPDFFRKHPRRGGEDEKLHVSRQAVQETPPPRRGRPVGSLSRCAACRNTPAEAGKTFPNRSGTTSPQKHPRRGGEDGRAPQGLAAGAETPPPRRGRLSPANEAGHAARNTPAEAGKTHRRTCRHWRYGKHPRRGGEDFDSLPAHIRMRETPPPRRGRQQHMVAVC